MTVSVSSEAGFEELTARHRRELHVHCYRMLASYDEAEDAVQETYLRAWRSRATFDGEHARAWLYKIATNTCLDALRSRTRRAAAVRSYADVAWLTPYPDRLLDEVAPADDQPEVVVVARETIELAFLAALQALPPRQRAALIAREVLGMPAAETAELLDTSVAAANSALQRARATMRAHLPSHRSDWSARSPSPAEKELLDAFIDAHVRCDAAAALAVAATDIRVTMPPAPMCFDGRDALLPLLDRAFGPDREGDWLLVPTAVNRMPAAASYLRRSGDTAYRGLKLDVLRIESTGRDDSHHHDSHPDHSHPDHSHPEEPRIAEITTFGWSWFERLGLPLVHPA